MLNNLPKLPGSNSVSLSEKEGGLGVINLSVRNGSLLLKFLHKFFTKVNIPHINLVYLGFTEKYPFGGGTLLSYWTPLKEWPK